MRLRDTDIGWPLEELWVTGDLLTPIDTLDTGTVVVVVDVPPDELPWLALHPAAEWIADQLRLGKRPMRWYYRPLLWPVWNHRHRRLARLWTAADGLDQAVIEALQSHDLLHVSIIEPEASELIDQLRDELVVSQRHLRVILDNYWDRDWRRNHKGYDESPEEHLWRAATAVVEIGDALDSLIRYREPSIPLWLATTRRAALASAPDAGTHACSSGWLRSQAT